MVFVLDIATALPAPPSDRHQTGRRAAAVKRSAAFPSLFQRRLERLRIDIVDRFKPNIRTTPEVMNGYCVTGRPPSCS